MTFELDHIAFTHKARHETTREIFRDFSLKVSRGERIGILGEEGSGKTTLLYLLAGLLPPTRGSIRIDGTDPHTDPHLRASVQRRIGITFQFPEEQFIRETVSEEFREVLALRDVAPIDVPRRMEESLRFSGLDPAAYSMRSPFSLSLGESRRVALALILAMRPEGILMDEPTAGLDASGTASTVRSLTLLGDQGATIITATHDIDLLASIAQRVVIIEGGAIEADDSAEAILSNVRLLTRHGYDLPEIPSTRTLQKSGEAGRGHAEHKQGDGSISEGDRDDPVR